MMSLHFQPYLSAPLLRPADYIKAIQAESWKGMADILLFLGSAHSKETGIEEQKPSCEIRLFITPKTI
jgi:hypothetical protein